MKLSEIEVYEIRAEAFRRMTGHMAPGKDVSPGAWSEPYEAREAAYKVWCQAHGAVVMHVIAAVTQVIYIAGEDDEPSETAEGAGGQPKPSGKIEKEPS